MRFVKFRILHIDDSPQRIARGIAVGLFIGYLPLVGLHMLLAFVLAKLIRANKAMAVMWVWVSNPLTFVIIYYPCYRVGRLIAALFHHKSDIDVKQLELIFVQHLSFWGMISNLFSYDYWKELAGVFARVGLEMFIGGIFLGAIVAGAGYWLTCQAVTRYRQRKHKRKDFFASRRSREDMESKPPL